MMKLGTKTRLASIIFVDLIKAGNGGEHRAEIYDWHHRKQVNFESARADLVSSFAPGRSPWPIISCYYAL
jgi:hypothetical protein